MNTIKNMPGEDDLRFHSISEFRHFVNRGQLCNFNWEGKSYHVCSVWKGGERLLLISETASGNEAYYHSAEDLLSHRFGDNCLKEIITKVEVTDQSY